VTSGVRARGGAGDPESDKEPEELDDTADRDELRRRYEVLLQETRVSLPGVQVLSAFLLTVPFSQRFDELDAWGRRSYGVALVSSMLSVICLVAPILLHRLGEREARADRLRWGIRLQVLGMAFLAIALVTAVWSVARFVFNTSAAWALVTPVFALIVLAWVALPLSLRRR
jgi:Family of unknown function (DUF6328)